MSLNKLKVAHIITSLESKGQVRVVQQLVNSSDENINSSDFIVDLFYLDKNRIELYFARNPQYFNLLSILALRKYRIIHSHNIRSDLYVFLLKFFGLIKNSVWVTSIHQHFFIDLLFRYGKYSFRRVLLSALYGHLLSKVDAAVVLSEEMRCYYKNLGFNCKFFVVFNALSIGDSTMVLAERSEHIENRILQFKQNGRIVLGNACNVSKGKALDQIIPFLLENTNCVYILIGDGPYLSELQQLVKINLLEERFIFFGRIPEAKLYFKYFDIFLFTSFSEGFPMSILEAGYSEVPILCSSLPEIEEHFVSQELCFFINNSIDSLRNSYNEVLENRDLFVRRMLLTLTKKFSSANMLAKYYDIYKKMI